MRTDSRSTHDPAGAADSELAVPEEHVLWNIAHLLASEHSQERVLEAVADALADLVPHDSLIVYQADLALRQLLPVLARDQYADEILASGMTPFGEGITGAAVEAGLPRLANDVHLDPDAVQIPGTPEDEEESMVVIPLTVRDQRKGALCMYRMGPTHHFSEHEFRLAIRFGELAALAIDNADTRARLEAEVVTDHLTSFYNHRYFQERLKEELKRAGRRRTPVSLLLFDIDDFKRVNDSFGHQIGDQVLQGLATVVRGTCRVEDVLCRIGGEEFAVILPQASQVEGLRLAERLRSDVAGTPFPVVGQITVSTGVAEAPAHASSPRDLIACADVALLQAKAEGKDRVRLYGTGGSSQGRPAPGRRGEVREVAHMKMLQSLATKLNRLNDVRGIGEAITLELRSLIDYHNCRIHLVAGDGVTLEPIVFRGELTEYQGETYDALLTEVGEGITGHVAKTGRSLYLPDASQFDEAVQIPGTPELDESMIGVPLRYGDRVTGTIVLSKLGIDQFDPDDMRLLEVLASNAAVALENAKLLEQEREAAEISGTLLYLSDVLSRARDTEAVLDEALASIPVMLGCDMAQIWMRDPQTGEWTPRKWRGLSPEESEATRGLHVPQEVADRFLLSVDRPFVLEREVVATVPSEYRIIDQGEPRATLVAPIRWDPDGMAALLVIAPTGEETFGERHLRLARGITDIAALALGNARRYDELERAYVATVESLANALEAKDEYTGDHARALAELSLAVGEELGLDEEPLKTLELAALFHDIGKIGVPSEIIRKPGPLSAPEMREVKRHPEIGEQILAPVPFLQPIRPIVRACHERWDGKGYPDGSAGEAIPLEARIVFVCDAFHAMTTTRPYREALPEGEAIRRLKLSSGTQFDPAVVEAFVRLHEAGRIEFQLGHDHPGPGGNGRVSARVVGA
jgi:diguanylate cyclase (GGDEF)-like protein